MSRIRSVHPGFFTDEDLVSVSMEARLLFIGLGVEADDKGVFQWKPLTLKMRIFPADNLDMEALLAELAGIDAIVTYEIGGRQYGAIRNFRKFQKPKTPNDVHPLPNNLRNYVGLKPAISETSEADDAPFPPNGEMEGAKPDPFPPKEEKSFQMEGRGGEEGKEEPPNPLSKGGESASNFADFWKAYPERNEPDPDKPAAAQYRAAIKAGATPSQLLAGAKALAAKHRSDQGQERKFIPKATTWLSEGRWKTAKSTAAKTGPPTDIELVSGWLKGYRWIPRDGPPPTMPGYRGDLRAAVLLLANRYVKGRVPERCEALQARWDAVKEEAA